MAEYIERSYIRKMAMFEMAYTMETETDAAVVLRMIDDAPAADVAPVVHGRWGTGRFNLETGNYEEQCTRCRNFSKEYGKPYCPNCGAYCAYGKRRAEKEPPEEGDE